MNWYVAQASRLCTRPAQARRLCYDARPGNVEIESTRRYLPQAGCISYSRDRMKHRMGSGNQVSARMIVMTHLRKLALGLSMIGFMAAAWADDTRSDKGWPQFRGPNGAGLADESKPPTEWGTDKNVQWKAAIPGVAWSSPIVWGDKVFVTTAVTDKQTKPQAGGGFGGMGGFGGGPGGGRARGEPGGVSPRSGGFGRGGFGGPPQVGQLLPPFLQGMFQLNDDQKKQLEELQKDSDDKLAKILTDDQNKQLKDMREGGGQ